MHVSRPSTPLNTLLAWTLTFCIAALAWIPTLQQTLAMHGTQAYSTMGLTVAPFLFFWTVMMAAMMLPALAPTVAAQLQVLRRQRVPPLLRILRACIFIIGYLFVWCLFGLFIFLVSSYSHRFIEHNLIIGVALGIGLFLGVGIYQLTTLKYRYLLHCNPALDQAASLAASCAVLPLPLSLYGGMKHGLSCLGCCGGLMLLMLPVGLMNLPCMIFLTVLVFLEKAWRWGHQLAFFTGSMLIFCGLFFFIDPSLLTTFILH